MLNLLITKLKAIVIIALGAILATAVVAQPFTDVAPPDPFRRDNVLTLDLKDQAGIDRTCHPLYGAPPPGMRTNGCTVGSRVIVPNPCDFAETEAYARLLCHELGHVNGWPASHGT